MRKVLTALTALLACVCMAGAIDGQNVVASWSGPSSQGDLQYKDTSGNILLSLGSTLQIGSASAPVDVYADGLDLTADLVLENDERIDNSNDANVAIQFNDDAATLGNLIIESTVAGASIADDDKLNIKYNTPDASSNSVNWVTLEAEITDNTANTKDSKFEVKTYTANTQIDALTIDGEKGDTLLNFGVDNATLGQLYVKSVNAGANMADNDVLEVVFDAQDSASNSTDVITLGAKFTDVTSTSEDSQLIVQGMTGGSEQTFLTMGSSAAGALAATFYTGMEVSIDGKYAVVGPDATTAQMVLSKAVTASGTTETNTFDTVFGAAPIVTCTYTEDPGDVRPIYITATTPSNFICEVASSKNFQYIAVGQRP